MQRKNTKNRAKGGTLTNVKSKWDNSKNVREAEGVVDIKITIEIYFLFRSYMIGIT